MNESDVPSRKAPVPDSLLRDELLLELGGPITKRSRNDADGSIAKPMQSPHQCDLQLPTTTSTPPPFPPNAADRVPLDIWHMIAQYLRQPLPIPGDPSVTWKQLHQHDLATLMRVCKASHCSAAFVLYSEVVVDNPTGIIHGWNQEGFDKTICGPLIAPIHKRHLLAQVRAVHYVYSSADDAPYGPGGITARVAGDHHTRKPSDSNLITALRFIKDSGPDFSRYFAFHSRSSLTDRTGDNPIARFFSRLERRTIGLWHPARWCASESPAPVGFESLLAANELATAVELFLAAMMPLPVPKNICRSAIEGPLGCKQLFDTEAVNCQVMHPIPADRLQLQSLCKNIYFGAENRINIGHVLESDGSRPSDHGLLERLLDGPLGLVAALHPDLWGAPWPSLFYGRYNYGILQHTKVVLMLSRSHPQTDEAGGLDSQTLSFINERIGSELARRLSVGLKGKRGYAQSKWGKWVSVVWADTVGPCPACGQSCTPGV